NPIGRSRAGSETVLAFTGNSFGSKTKRASLHEAGTTSVSSRDSGQAMLFRRRRAKAKRPAHAAITPGKPAPTSGPGTATEVAPSGPVFEQPPRLDTTQTSTPNQTVPWLPPTSWFNAIPAPETVKMREEPQVFPDAALTHSAAKLPLPRASREK